MNDKTELAIATAALSEIYPNAVDGKGCDVEMAHSNADEILLDYLRKTGASDLADEWEALSRRCGGFWYA